MKKLAILCVSLVGLTLTASAAKRPLTFEDLMKFRQITSSVISKDGEWVGYVLKPDRGDGSVVVRAVGRRSEHAIPRGGTIALTPDGSWAVAKRLVSFELREKKDEDAKPGLVLLSTADGEQTVIERVKSHALSDDGRWLAYLHHAEEEEENEEDAEAAADSTAAESEEEERTPGTTLVLRNLESGEETRIEFVESYSFDEPSAYLAYTVATKDGADNGIYIYSLATDGSESFHTLPKGSYSHLTWAKDASRLAYVAGLAEDEDDVREAELHLWEPGSARRLASVDDAPEGWEIPAANSLHFSQDGERLFFGFKPKAEEDEGSSEADSTETEFDPYDREALLEKINLSVWHWDDPLIATDVRIGWDSDEKNRSYRAVVHLDRDKVVPLADLEMRALRISQNPRWALGTADTPYLKEQTWAGWFQDLYLVDLEGGGRQLLASRTKDVSSLSPDGKLAVYYQDGHWYLVDTERGETRTLNEGMEVPFANEDHDYPSTPGSYGVGGWVAGSEAVFIYDKYDLWQFPTDGSTPLRLTAGREEKVRFRLIKLDPDALDYATDGELLFEAYDDWNKNDAFHSGQVGVAGTRRLREQEKLFEFKAKAEDADRILYTEESYSEFPDLWVSDSSFRRPRKISDVNPQIDEFAWGEAGLIEWDSLDGKRLQGVVIKPGDYEEGKRYPVLVYFYRFFSQRLHQFNEPVINHRPSFPMYASNGYIVFLPDVRFEIGRPGDAALKCVVPGVQKLIDMGLAKPDGVGLHGHSWSGYTSAYIVTQTDLFAACVSGAPVSNMTSAYGGIRWGTGISRQWQYEMSQSRIGGSLWEYPMRYIESSPLFYADRMNTPLVIQHGDVDEAVPWYQSIEFYMALRRNEKPCVFLQYEDEPHHLKKYPNKLDYSIKMMEFFDHFCKGEPAPEWWTDGVPYTGDD